jgi:hypothetical protein
VNGFAIIRGLYSTADLEAIEREGSSLQEQLISGSLPTKCGDVTFTDDRVELDIRPTVHYVCHTTEVSATIRDACLHPALQAAMRTLIGHDAWLLESERFGVVYQDARPGKESAYTRIGWHSDWQSGPHLDCWPSMAFTIHIDATSPCNGFLRVVPGSHRWATPTPTHDIDGVPVPENSRPTGGHTDEPPPVAMPVGFDKVPGEIAVYAERGDVILHDAYVWHSASRGTDDDAIRRHLRGGWYSGQRFPEGFGIGAFVKNAQR